MSPHTFPALLATEAARAGSRPLVTFYDDATGERVELSVLTYANWVAKTAGLLQDELGVERGATVLLDLPTHWLGAVWLGAAWTVGAAVTDRDSRDVEVVVCGPNRVESYADPGRPVVATALLPLARRFQEPLPAGVVDFGEVVWGQPDAFAAVDPVTADDVAWASGGRPLDHAHLVSAATSWAAEQPPGVRLLTDLNPCSAAGLWTLAGPLAGGGGTVWVRNPDPAPEAWQRRAEAERVTALAKSQPTRS